MEHPITPPSELVQKLRKEAPWGIRAALATPPPLAPDYIDPEHHGEARELLQVFYAACNAEGGTADEIHLRGIRAVMAARATLEATPPPEPPKPPTDQELDEFVVFWWGADTDKRTVTDVIEDYSMAAFARAAGERWGHG